MSASTNSTDGWLLSADEVAQILDCHTETVELAARTGRLPGVKFGRAWRFPSEALIQVLNAQALASMEAKPARPELVRPVRRRLRRNPIPQLPSISSAIEAPSGGLKITE